MATVLFDKERHVVPRWRDFRTTVAVGELASMRVSTTVVDFPDRDFLASKLRDWHKHKTISHATDLVSAASVVGRSDDAREAAEYILNSREYVPSAAKSIANEIVTPSAEGSVLSLANRIETFNPTQIRERIHYLRLRLRDEPRNTVIYVDLARLYTLLDQIQKAETSIEMAIKLDPTNRFVLRSAARFFVHFHEAARAHEILRRSEASSIDPWLMAAEIAVASAGNIPSRYAKKAQRILSGRDHEPFELTELASAVATLDLQSGKARDARKLFRKALISPTENSVAQVEWASNKIAGLDEVRVSQFEQVPRLYEAQAREYYSESNWKGALEQTWNWLYDQPFSRRPASFGSYIAATVGDYEQGIEILKRGLVANPDAHMLLNNIAFAYASSGKLHEALKAFEQIDKTKATGAEQVVLTATRGLLAFRCGRLEEGRSNYLAAIDEASHHFSRLKIMASIYLAREEMLARTPHAKKARENALELAKAVKDADIQQVIDRELAVERSAKSL
jgi:tetratricopeptide (TPR) repeat protein